MKLSQLKEIVAKIVQEELQRQIPLVMSEMFIRTIVQECVRGAAPLAESLERSPRQQAPKRRPAPRSKLEEALEIDPSAGSEFYGSYEEPAIEERPERGSPRQMMRNLNPMLAALAEDTVESLERGEYAEDDVLPTPNFDFGSMKKMINLMEGQKSGPIRDPNAEQRRVDMVRKKAESRKIG